MKKYFFSENALTIDVEDYFQVSAFASHIDKSSWDSLDCRVEKNIDKILSRYIFSQLLLSLIIFMEVYYERSN